MTADFRIICAGTVLGAGLAAVTLYYIIMFKECHSAPTLLRKSAFLELSNLVKKLSWRDFFDNNIRAETGNPVKRPFGTNIHFFRWDRLQFSPVYLSRKPLAAEVPIITEVILGPQAQKPLILKIPIINGGMSYGSSLSFKAKIALAKGATLAGTATNSGTGTFLEEERASADRYILQFSRGFWSKSEKILRQADMIEIALGHGSWGPVPVRISGREVTDGFAKRLNTIPGLDVLIEARLPEVENMTDWKSLILKLKEVTGGVPIAVKIGTTHLLEPELDLILQGDIDVLVIDGAEGGTHACPVILVDDVGTPTFPSLCRAVNYWERRKLKGKVSLVVGGGLFTPGDFLKCLALGADAVIVGTIAALVMSHTQVTKVTPWEPPTQIIYYGAKKAAKYDPDLGAQHLHYFYQSCLREMQQAARALGKRDLRQINKSDLVALDPEYAKMAGVEYLN
jgi:glutamate synthase domain-containing protein 2